MPAVSGTSFPLTVSGMGGEPLVIPAAPQRILPANAGSVDFLALLVTPDRVVGLPETTEAYSPLTRLDGRGAWAALPRFASYAGEAVLSLEPDLVLTHTWQNPETTALLRRSGLRLLSLPTPRSWEEVLQTLHLYGRVLGEEERARAVALELESRVEELARRARARSPLRAMSYANFGAGGSTAGRGTTLDVVLGLAGLQNAAALAGIEGYASIDHERLLAIDPDLLVVDGAGDEGAGSQAERYLRSQPELASLRALRDPGDPSGQTSRTEVLALPSALFTTVSTELVTAAEELQRALGW
jgi:iron complex transport system substrate-binding protein